MRTSIGFRPQQIEEDGDQYKGREIATSHNRNSIYGVSQGLEDGKMIIIPYLIRKADDTLKKINDPSARIKLPWSSNSFVNVLPDGALQELIEGSRKKPKRKRR